MRAPARTGDALPPALVAAALADRHAGLRQRLGDLGIVAGRAAGDPAGDGTDIGLATADVFRLPGTDYARTILGRRRHGTRGDLGRRRPGRRRQCRHLGVQGIALALVVGLQDDREVGLLTLGQVAAGERQPGRQDWRAAGQGGSRSLAGPVRPVSATTEGTAPRHPCPMEVRSVSYARLSSSTGMVRTPAVWRSYSAKPG